MDPTGMIPIFGNLAFTIVAFIVALSVIIAIHEYGHYIVGRWSGIKADVFSIGFGPVLASKVDKHGTKWQIAALPLGGFVKFRGDANAASAPEDGALDGLSADERRATMQGAPLWARSATVAAGPVFNFILSFFLFAGLILVQGVPSDPIKVESLRTLPNMESELREGDVILGIAGVPLSEERRFGDVASDLEPSKTLTYQIERDGVAIDVVGPWVFPTIVGSLTPGDAAAKAGLIEGEVVTKINGAPVFDFGELRDAVGNSDGNPVEFELWNEAGETRTVSIEPRRRDIPLQEGGFETRWLIGMGLTIPFETASVTPPLGEAVSYGFGQIGFIFESSLSGLYHMVAGRISVCNLSGPIGIAQVSGQAASQGATSFIWFIALLSTAVGMLNLFPIPILDGGHLVFHAFEAVTGRPPSEKALRYMMIGGLTVMVMLMALSFSADLVCRLFA